MEIKAIIGGVILVALAAPVAAAEWRMGAVGDDRAIFVERTSLRNEGGRTKFWIWIVPKGREGGSDNVKAFVSADCTAMKLEFVAVHEFDGKKELPMKPPPPGDDDLIPDSLAYRFTSMACGKTTWGKGPYEDPYFSAKWHFRQSLEGSAR